MNYTEEITIAIVNAYLADPTKECVERLAAQYDKPTKSIIGKLSREKVYRRQVYTSKTGESPITKDEIVQSIGDILGIPKSELLSLEKTSKTVLKLIQTKLEK